MLVAQTWDSCPGQGRNKVERPGPQYLTIIQYKQKIDKSQRQCLVLILTHHHPLTSGQMRKNKNLIAEYQYDLWLTFLQCFSLFLDFFIFCERFCLQALAHLHHFFFFSWCLPRPLVHWSFQTMLSQHGALTFGLNNSVMCISIFGPSRPDANSTLLFPWFS